MTHMIKFMVSPQRQKDLKALEAHGYTPRKLFEHSITIHKLKIKCEESGMDNINEYYRKRGA